METFFHVATEMNPQLPAGIEPTKLSADELCTKRWKHVGNDSVLVVWNASDVEYRPSMLPTKVCVRW